MHPLVRIHRAYVAFKAVVIALGMILLGAAVCAIAFVAIRLGMTFVDWNADFTAGTNLFAIICFVIALVAGGYGVSRCFEALPYVTPRRINRAPGQSRWARRDDLRRHRII
jgi:uncharacterized membrane protein